MSRLERPNSLFCSQLSHVSSLVVSYTVPFPTTKGRVYKSTVLQYMNLHSISARVLNTASLVISSSESAQMHLAENVLRDYGRKTDANDVNRLQRFNKCPKPNACDKDTAFLQYRVRSKPAISDQNIIYSPSTLSLLLCPHVWAILCLNVAHLIAKVVAIPYIFAPGVGRRSQQNPTI